MSEGEDLPAARRDQLVHGLARGMILREVRWTAPSGRRRSANLLLEPVIEDGRVVALEETDRAEAYNGATRTGFRDHGCSVSRLVAEIPGMGARVRWLSDGGIQRAEAIGFELDAEGVAFMRSLRPAEGMRTCDLPGLRNPEVTRETLIAGKLADIATNPREGTARALWAISQGLVLVEGGWRDRGNWLPRLRLRRPVTDDAGRIVAMERDRVARAVVRDWDDLDGFTSPMLDMLAPLLDEFEWQDGDRTRKAWRISEAAVPGVHALVEDMSGWPEVEDDTRQQAIIAMLEGRPMPVDGPGPTFDEIAEAIMSDQERGGVDAGARARRMIAQALAIARRTAPRR